MVNFAEFVISTIAGWRKTAALLPLLCLWGCGGGQEAAMTPEQLAGLRARSEAFAGQDAAALRGNAEAMALGQELFAAYCAGCHGSGGAAPARNTPNLATGVFDYGDSVEAIRATITQGRHSLMPKHGGEMGEVDIGSLVALVQAMASGEQMNLFEKSARTLYETHCVECHGPQGRGNPALGVPNLTDSYWQHGDAMMNIRMVITRGAESQCPAQQNVLSAAEIELLTAQVLQLRGG